MSCYDYADKATKVIGDNIMKPKNIEIISTIASIIFLCMLAEIGTKAFVIGFLLGISMMISAITEVIRALKGE